MFTWDGNPLIERAHIDRPGAAATVTTWDYLLGSFTPVSQRVGGSNVDTRFYAVVSDLVGTPT